MDASERRGGVLTVVYDALHAGLAIAAALLIAFIALGISADVLSRNLGWGSIRGMLELAEYALFLSTFLGAPWVLARGAHVRVDVVVDTLPRRVGWLLEILGDVVGLITSAVLFWYAWSIADTAFAEGRRIIKEFIFPEGWIFVAVAASAALLIVEFVLRLWRARTGPVTPAGKGAGGF